MNHHPRKPAVIVLTVAAVLAGVFLVAWNKVEAYYKEKRGGNTIEAMEQRIAEEKKAGAVSPQTWLAFGQLLMDGREYDRAAAAFKEVLEIQPLNRDAKFQRGLALAQSGQSDAFYQFQKDLVYSEAKLAVELFERTEAQRYLGEDRFSALEKEAKNQAMD
jgi:cytochrome c-type biogenesis protein CcmH/NrfG